MGQVIAVDFGGPDPLLSKRELSKHPEVRRSPRWIEQRVGEGMPSQLIDGKRMFQLGEVIDWLAERGRTRRATPTEPDAALVERLERWRESAADGGPPSTVLKYEALKRIAATQPQSIAALRAVKGVGPSFLARHGASLAALLGIEAGVEPVPSAPLEPPTTRAGEKTGESPPCQASGDEGSQHLGQGRFQRSSSARESRDLSTPGLATSAAARLLGTTANTLRSWERRYGFPKPSRTEGGQRRYGMATIEALRDALGETDGEIGGAVELALKRLTDAKATAKAAGKDEARIEALERRVAELERRLQQQDHSEPPPAA